MKKCTKCKIEKELTDFGKHKENKDGLTGDCKSCKKEYDKERYQANKEYRKEYRKEYYQANKERRIEQVKEYRKANKEKIKEYYQDNKEKIKEYNKKYNQSNKERINEYTKERRLKDPLFKMTNNLRCRTSNAFKRKGYNKNTQTQEMLGVDWEVCKAHIEKQFTKGMTLDNQGKWHVDHIIPLSSAVNKEELMTLCNYQNLQPLWAKDNIEKSDKYNEIDKVNMIKKIKDSLIQKVSQVIEK
jgi:hypothetical protein|tara:strand:+ start:572 stop:1300 length:729 start_codon:yes stop_codon:yes gene_type:complete